MADDLRAVVFQVSPDPMPGVLTWGWIGLVASPRGLRFLGLPVVSYDLALRRLRRHYHHAVLVEKDAFLDGVTAQLRAYLVGQLQQYDVDLDLRGHTSFELQVWAATTRIPYGETRTYGWLAAQVGGGPGAAQAAGAALGGNPVPLIVPCHRVIGSDGSLHGFAGGLDMKARLLALENHQLALPFA